MDFHAEAVIADEFMKFVTNGSLYLGSKPVMWSPVEQTALAEAEIEYQDHQSQHDLGEVPEFDPDCGRRSREHLDQREGAILRCVGHLDGASGARSDLDHDALDDPVKSGSRLHPDRSHTGSTRLTPSPEGNWMQASETRLLLATKLALMVS